MVIVALGSNLGDSAANVRAAMDRLESLSGTPLRRSSLWQSAPVDCPAGSANFINAVVILTPRPDETPETLLSKLQAMERDFGRQPKRLHNEPRLIDMDLIAFGAERRETGSLILPHPRAHERRFVLQPLAELAPDLKLPGQNATVSELLNGLPEDRTVRKIQ